MNVQSTKIELMKIIADINSDKLLKRLKAWLMQQVKVDNPAHKSLQKEPNNDKAFIVDDGFLIFTGSLSGGFEAFLEDERMKRDLSLM